MYIHMYTHIIHIHLQLIFIIYSLPYVQQHKLLTLTQVFNTYSCAILMTFSVPSIHPPNVLVHPIFFAIFYSKLLNRLMALLRRSSVC